MPQARPQHLLFFFLALAGGWVSTSCRFEYTPSQQNIHARLDSSLYHLEESIATVPIDTVRWITGRMNTSLEALRTAYADTTDTLFLTESLPQYQEAYDALRQLPHQLEQLNEQIDYSKRQLSGLKADVERGKLKPEEADQFLSKEEDHMQELLNRADTLKHILQSALRRYYDIQPQVEERI